MTKHNILEKTPVLKHYIEDGEPTIEKHEPHKKKNGRVILVAWFVQWHA